MLLYFLSVKKLLMHRYCFWMVKVWIKVGILWNKWSKFIYYNSMKHWRCKHHIPSNILKKKLSLRSSRSQMLFKIGVFKNFAIFRRNYLCWSLFLTKLLTWRSAALLTERLQHRCLPVNIAKFLRIAFFMEQVWWLLL